MTSEPTIREKGRAVFLAAIMVLSVVAMSAAFAGSAAAEDLDYEPSFAYQGQTVDVTPGDGFDADEIDHQVRKVTDTSDGDVSSSSHVEDLTSSDFDEGVFHVDTEGYDEGDYFVRGDGFDHNPAVEDTFEVGIQSLDVEFDDDEVTDEGIGAETEIEFDSNRGEYYVNVSADGDLDYEELYGIFNHSEDEFDISYDTDYDDELITLEAVTDGDYDISFEGIDTGDYDFDFEVVDTDAEAQASITVEEYDVDGDFSQGVYTQSAGDLVEITLGLEDTDDAFIQIGDEDAGFVDVVHVEDDDNDEVSFWINTRMLGAPGVDDVNDVYYSEDADIDSVVHGTLENSSSGETVSDGVNFYDEDTNEEDAIDFDEYLDELGISADDGQNQVVRPLQATDYSLTADANGHFVVDDGESSAENEIDAATLDLLTPELGEITTHVAPSDDADEDDELGDLLDVVTERTDVAEDDRLIIEAEATGIYGALAAHSDNGFNILEDGAEANALYDVIENSGEGINFEVEADDAIGNQDPTSLNLYEGDVDDEDVFILVDNDEGAFYVIVDTSSSDAFDGNLEDGQTFDVELEYETDSDDRYGFYEGAFDGGADGVEDGDAAYPYFSADSTESVSTAFTIVEPEAHFDNLDADDNVQLENGEEVVVTGETNIAPGSSADLRISNAGDTASFLSTEDAEINSDGTFESEYFDFSDRDEGDEAELNFRVSGSSVGSADGIFVESVDEEEPEEDDEADDEEADDEAADDEEADDEDADDHVDEDDDHVDEDDDHVEDDDDEVETEDDGVPGFGIAVALFALIAAGMLALRRQN